MIDHKVELEDIRDRHERVIEKLSKSEYSLLRKVEKWRAWFLELGINPDEVS
jgi:hypothetical protein